MFRSTKDGFSFISFSLGGVFKTQRIVTLLKTADPPTYQHRGLMDVIHH